MQPHATTCTETFLLLGLDGGTAGSHRRQRPDEIRRVALSGFGLEAAFRFGRALLLVWLCLVVLVVGGAG